MGKNAGLQMGNRGTADGNPLALLGKRTGAIESPDPGPALRVIENVSKCFDLMPPVGDRLSARALRPQSALGAAKAQLTNGVRRVLLCKADPVSGFVIGEASEDVEVPGIQRDNENFNPVATQVFRDGISNELPKFRCDAHRVTLHERFGEFVQIVVLALGRRMLVLTVHMFGMVHTTISVARGIEFERARLASEPAKSADCASKEIRRSQNWIGGTRPGNARFVPPPPDEVAGAMSALEKWIHATDPLPPLVRVGLAHVQFETIHPFLDGNGRIGRLLIALLAEHWGLLKLPLLYLSVAFKRHREEYYRLLGAVRTQGDWEGWTGYFLDCVREAAQDGVSAAQRLFLLIGKDRIRLANHPSATVAAIRLFDQMPAHPIVTLATAIKLLNVTKPTAGKAIDALRQARILRETTGRKRDRVYAYDAYLKVLTTDTG